MDNDPQSERKSALPPGFGQDDNTVRRNAAGSPVLLSVGAAVVASIAVAAVVPRVMGTPSRTDALTLRLAQIEEQQTILNVQLSKMNARLEALAKVETPRPAADDADSIARVKLEARVDAGSATGDEVIALRAICRRQNDKICSDRMTDLLAELPDAAVSANDASALGAFDKTAAIRTLLQAAAQARRCGRLEGRSGSARVTVTFEPSGVVSVVEISGDVPRKEAAKACVQAAFRSARVPPFEGPSVKVSKSAELVAPETTELPRSPPPSSDLEY